MTLSRVRILSPNYSSRGGSRVRLIVIHSSEGAQTYQALGNFFKNPSSGVSSHVGIDDTPNVIGEYVDRNAKAWTAANANPVAVQAELCTPSGASVGWSTAVWNSHPVMLQNLAQWIKEEAAVFGIPLVLLTPQQATSNGVGICQHRDLGSWGGGHVDCGPNFPIADVIRMAQGVPEPTPEEIQDMKAFGCAFQMDDKSQQVFYISDKGQLMHYYFNGATQKWVGEGFGTNWHKDSELQSERLENGTWRVWGVLANGQRAQCYWSGKAWVTQNL